MAYTAQLLEFIIVLTATELATTNGRADCKLQHHRIVATEAKIDALRLRRAVEINVMLPRHTRETTRKIRKQDSIEQEFFMWWIVIPAQEAQNIRPNLRNT